MMVSAGFTAELDGKKLPSTTYRLSRSWALQFTSSTELRVASEAAGAVLVRHAGERDALADVGVEPRQALVALRAVNVARYPAEQVLDLGLEPLVPLFVVGRIRKPRLPAALHGHAVRRIRQVFRGEPEVERVLRHLVERPARRELGRARRQHVRVGLADERDVAERIFPVVRAVIVIVQGERLLEHGRIRALGDR